MEDNREIADKGLKKVILLTGESVGYGDTVIGYEVLATALEALLRRKEGLPAAIVCINTAVNIVSEDSPMVSRLKILEERGVQIIAGRYCVNEMGLTNKIAVGKVKTLTEIMDFLLSSDVDVISL